MGGDELNSHGIPQSKFRLGREVTCMDPHTQPNSRHTTISPDVRVNPAFSSLAGQTPA